MAWKPEVLIVDDEPRIIQSLEEVLDQKGYVISTAGDSQEACRLIEQKHYDLVLLDLIMPGQNGLKVLDYIHQRSPRTSVIILTGYASTDSAVECLRRGAYDYLKKPFELEELQRRVQNAMDQKRLEVENEVINNKLELSEARYQYLLQNSPDIIYTLDREGRFTFISGSVKDILGCSGKELIGKPYTEIIYYDDLEKAQHTFNERRASHRQHRNIELRLKSANESGVTIELKAKGLYEKSKEGKEHFIGTYGVARDITMRKQAEKELKLQKDYFQQLFENSPAGIAIMDNSGRILAVNKSFERLFKYTMKETKRQPIDNLIVPEEYLEEAQSLSARAQSAVTVHQETVRKRKDGSLVEVSVLAYPIRHENRQIGIYGIYNDIAQRKRSEEELQTTLEKLRKAMGATIQAMSSTVEARDPYTAGHQQRVSNLARAIAQEMGLSPEDVDGIRMAGAIHDLGKINIPAEILSKPRRLTDVEFGLIKTHPEIAYEILKEIDFPWPVAEIVYQHHEKMDGSGYPRGLQGKEILLAGRILTVSDVVEAIASYRPYRPALGIKSALNEIREKRAVHYDPQVVDACIHLFANKQFAFE